jgi:DNA polymerase-4
VIGRVVRQLGVKAVGLTGGVFQNITLLRLVTDKLAGDGLTVLTHADLATRIWPLPARRINGVGPRASARLETLGIRTIGELAQADIGMLVEHFGERYARWLTDAARGHDERPVVTEREPKSVSRETTFERDLDAKRDRDSLAQTLLALCERVGHDLRRKGYAGKTIGVKLRYADFQTITRDTTLDHPTDDPQMIRNAARRCLKRMALDRRLRLLGVRVGSLVRAGEERPDSTPDHPSAQAGKAGESLPLFD